MKLSTKLAIAHLAVLGPFCAAESFHQRKLRYSDKVVAEDIAATEMEAWERILSDGSMSVPSKPAPAPAPKPSKPTVPDCCGLPPGQRAKELLALYSDVSDPNDIVKPGTPQFKAFNWILTEDAYCVCPDTKGCEVIQRYVMAVYYYSTVGEGWTNCGADSTICNATASEERSGCFPGHTSRWLADVQSCDWCGNDCDDPNYPGCITQINLDNITQSGTIPFELQNITYLYYISNEDGTISSTIPPELGNLKNLSFFDLNFQDIEGSIPDSFYKRDSLALIDLNDNKMTGSISSHICNLPDLFFLQLGNDKDGTNDFSGTLPNCIGSLSKLQVLDVSKVGLVGTLPSFTQPTLQFLDVSQNELTGNLNGTNWGALTGLQTLVLGENKFTGTIPSRIGGASELRLADFTDTDLTGTMPSEICALRTPPTGTGNLEFLQADCAGSPPQVACSCCTFCTP